jgi:hypothetical protein
MTSAYSDHVVSAHSNASMSCVHPNACMSQSAVEDLRLGDPLSHDYSGLYSTCLSITGASGAQRSLPLASLQCNGGRVNTARCIQFHDKPFLAAYSLQPTRTRCSRCRSPWVRSHVLVVPPILHGCLAANRHPRSAYDYYG